jgi:hypothetical protein
MDMAQTPAAVQAALGTGIENATIIRAMEYSEFDTTHQQWYVDGRCDYPGRKRWCTSTASDSAANQAVSIQSALSST